MALFPVTQQPTVEGGHGGRGWHLLVSLIEDVRPGIWKASVTSKQGPGKQSKRKAVRHSVHRVSLRIQAAKDGPVSSSNNISLNAARDRSG